MLEIKGLSFAYENDRPVLNGVDMALEDGQVGILLGRNGAGKSTLLKIITGVLKPSCGSVLFNGQDLLAMTRRERAANSRPCSRLYASHGGKRLLYKRERAFTCAGFRP